MQISVSAIRAVSAIWCRFSMGVKLPAMIAHSSRRAGPVENRSLITGPSEADDRGGRASDRQQVDLIRPCHSPGQDPSGATERIKTDRRDAEHLVRLLLAGKLSAVRIPGPPEEAMRDLVRARENLRMDLMRARHRLSKFLLRREIRFEGPGKNWTRRHLQWLAKLEFDDPAAQATFEDYRGAVEALLHRRGQLERRIEALIPGSPRAQAVGQLRCLRGIDTLAAVGLCAEVGDFAHFGRAGPAWCPPSLRWAGLPARLLSVARRACGPGELLA